MAFPSIIVACLNRVINLILNLLAFMIVVMGSFCSCDSDKKLPENDVTVEDSYSFIRNKICQDFGIDSEDYDESLFCFTFQDGLGILSTLRKEDSKLLVMAYDTLQGRFLIDECSRTIQKSKILPYYEESKEHSLRYILPRICRVGSGFIGFVGLRYVSDVGATDEVFGYFHDGIQLIVEEIKGGDTSADIMAWYDNSCLLVSYTQTLCVTNRGEIKWGIRERIPNINIYPIDYTNYISLRNNNGELDIVRYLIKDSTTESLWNIRVAIPFEFSSVPRLTFDIQSQDNNNWKILVKAVEQNGTMFQSVLNLDIETRIYSWE